MTVGQRVATGSVLFIVGAIAVGLGLDGYRPVQTLIHGGVGIGIVGLALAMSFAMPD